MFDDMTTTSILTDKPVTTNNSFGNTDQKNNNTSFL